MVDEQTTEPAGITTRERINISRTSTGNYSAETTCEITTDVGWAEVMAVAGNERADGMTTLDAFRACRLEMLGMIARFEIAQRKRAEAAS